MTINIVKTLRKILNFAQVKCKLFSSIRCKSFSKKISLTFSFMLDKKKKTWHGPRGSVKSSVHRPHILPCFSGHAYGIDFTRAHSAHLPIFLNPCRILLPVQHLFGEVTNICQSFPAQDEGFTIFHPWLDTFLCIFIISLQVLPEIALFMKRQTQLFQGTTAGYFVNFGGILVWFYYWNSKASIDHLGVCSGMPQQCQETQSIGG